MGAELPTPQEAYELLRATGEQYPDASDFVTVLPGPTYTDPEDGEQLITVDQRALAATGMIFSNHRRLLSALRVRQVNAGPIQTIHGTIDYLLQDESTLVLGLSGYASVFPGADYTAEADGITALYTLLAQMNRKPTIAIDGGVRQGCLGLNGVIASMHHVSTLGCIPFEGLSSIGLRDYTIVWGNTYQDREILVGTIPDVLVCVGGAGVKADGSMGCTLRECMHAVEHEGVALLLALRDYGPESLPGSYHHVPSLVRAENKGQLVVCRSIEELPASLEQVFEARSRFAQANRVYRQTTLHGLLTR